MNPVEAWTWPLTGDADVEPLLAMLSAQERERATRFRNARDRTAYVLAHAGMRVLLARRRQCAPAALDIAQAAGGKPFLHDAHGLHFNLSHSREHALFAIGPRALGVDIEAQTTLDALPDLLAQVATPAERAAILALPESEQQAAFFRLWVRKEALLKAIGSGLPGGAEAHAVGSTPWPEASWQALGQGTQAGLRWIGRQLPAPANHVAAIVMTADAHDLPTLHHHFLPTHWLADAAPASITDPTRSSTFNPDCTRGHHAWTI